MAAAGKYELELSYCLQTCSIYADHKNAEEWDWIVNPSASSATPQNTDLKEIKKDGIGY